eukprot:scaffold1182_cov124-Isochrysis_galbana.AAC.12
MCQLGTKPGQPRAKSREIRRCGKWPATHGLAGKRRSVERDWGKRFGEGQMRRHAMVPGLTRRAAPLPWQVDYEVSEPKEDGVEAARQRVAHWLGSGAQVLDEHSELLPWQRFLGPSRCRRLAHCFLDVAVHGRAGHQAQARPGLLQQQRDVKLGASEAARNPLVEEL